MAQHHGSKSDFFASEYFRRAGEKVANDDEGFIEFALSRKQEVIILDFGKEVKWLGFTAKQARDLAAMLCDYAIEAEACEKHMKRIGKK